MMNTTTPDGYQVDGNGCWIENGQVKTKSHSQQTSAAQGNVVTSGSYNGQLSASGMTATLDPSGITISGNMFSRKKTTDAEGHIAITDNAITGTYTFPFNTARQVHFIGLQEFDMSYNEFKSDLARAKNDKDSLYIYYDDEGELYVEIVDGIALF